MGIRKANEAILLTVEMVLLAIVSLALASSVALANELDMSPADEPGATPAGELGTAPANEQDAALATEGETPLATQDNPDLTPQNGVPLVIVRVNEEAGGKISDMNDSYNHSVRCESATVEIKVPEGCSGGYTSAGTDPVPSREMTLDYIRGRGNSTWTDSTKKPYKFQLSKKKDLFGMGASKDWALLANSFDATLMRNRITFWLGEQMGLSFTPQQVLVDLVMIGTISGVHEYGSYCLCETVKVGDTRVAIDKLKDDDTDNITGGYLMATYSNQKEGIPASTVFTTNYGVEFMNDTPEFDDTNPDEPLTEARLAQRDYIRDFMQELENLIMAPGDIDDARHAQIAQRMDLTSLANYWLLQEISFNTDAFGTTSTYLYKERDGKLCWGPLWDFDYGWNNNGMSNSSETFNNTTMLWIDTLRDKDPQFVSLLQQRWAALNGPLQELTRGDGIIDQYATEVGASQQADYEIWKGATSGYKGTSAEGYATAVESLRSWIIARSDWAETNKADIGKVFYTVSYEANGQVVATERVRHGNNAVMNPDAPAPAGQVFDRWERKKDKKTPDKVDITEDTVFEAHYENESDAVAPTRLTLNVSEETVNLSGGFFPPIDRYETTLDGLALVEPYEATNKRIRWTVLGRGGRQHRRDEPPRGPERRQRRRRRHHNGNALQRPFGFVCAPCPGRSRQVHDQILERRRHRAAER